MGWLLELLLDGIREICSQFIVDMMELVTEMFTELLSCNLSLFEELFSVVGSLYKNVIVPMGIALLLLILVWQLFKSMFGKSVNGEEPAELLIRSAIALFFVVASKPVVNYVLRVAGTPYQWVVGTEIQVESFSGFVSALEGVTETLGVGKLSISLLMLIMQFVVAWNYFKMLFVIAERYVLLGVFSYTAPLAFSTGGSKSTNNILASWAKMFGGQVVLVILNAWCMKMFLSGYGNMMASSYGFTKFFVATLCLVGFCKITFKLDSYMASLGVNLGRPSPGLGAMGLIMAASRLFSQIGRGNAGAGSGTSSSSSGTPSPSAGGGMADRFTAPIPMMPMADGTSGSAMDMPPDEVFAQKTDASAVGKDSGDFTPSPEQPSSRSVLEELGVSEPGTAGGADMGTGAGAGMGAGTSIGGTGGNGADGSSYGNRSAYGTDPESHAGAAEGKAGADMGFASGSMGTEMDLTVAGIPGYVDQEKGNAPEADESTGSNRITASERSFVEAGYGNGADGIASGAGDYPVEEEDFGSVDESAMELDGNTIDGMGGSAGTEGGSYGNAGDAFGNAGLSSRGGRSGGDSRGTGIRGAAGTGNMPGMDADGGILSEMGTDFDSGHVEFYGAAKAADAGEIEYPKTETPGSGGTMADMELGENSGVLSYMDSGAGAGGHSDIEPEKNGILHSVGKAQGSGTGYSGAEPETGGGVLSDLELGGSNGIPSGREQENRNGAYADMEQGDMDDMHTGMESVHAGNIRPDDDGKPGDADRAYSGMGSAGSVGRFSGMKSGGDGSIRRGMASGNLTDGSSLSGIGNGISESEAEESRSAEATPAAAMGTIAYGGIPTAPDRDAHGDPKKAGEAEDNRHGGDTFPEAPLSEMEGQMNQMGTVQTIPAGSRKGNSSRRSSRDFREVPKTREELRRMQQSRREQGMADGSPFD